MTDPIQTAVVALVDAVNEALSNMTAELGRARTPLQAAVAVGRFGNRIGGAIFVANSAIILEAVKDVRS
jgi:hypothetical protein